MVSLGLGCRWVDLDPMTANLRPRLPTVQVKNNETRLLFRHMAINAIACDVVVHLWEHGGLGFVATQTTS